MPRLLRDLASREHLRRRGIPSNPQTDNQSDTPNMVNFKSVDGGQLAAGQKFMIMKAGTLYIHYTTEQYPDAASDYSYVTVNGWNYRYFVSKTGNGSRTEVFPDQYGTFTAPFDVQYVFVACQVAVKSGVQYWYVEDPWNIAIERPEDRNEVDAINNQTDTLMNTDGSDDIASDGVVGGQVQQVQNLDIFGLIGDVSENVGNTITTQEVDTGVVFPGMSLAGFELPAATIDPMSGLSEDMRSTIKLMVTFVFCAAFISHIVSLAHAIFGIWEYGVGAEDFGNSEYTFSRRPVNWSGDYSIDEDLGF